LSLRKSRLSLIGLKVFQLVLVLALLELLA
jgi:hypothetical protein